MHLVYIPHGALLLGLPSAGQIPPALGSLTALQELSLPYNWLVGESHQSWRPSEDAHTIHPERVAGRARQTTSLRALAVCWWRRPSERLWQQHRVCRFSFVVDIHGSTVFLSSFRCSDTTTREAPQRRLVGESGVSPHLNRSWCLLARSISSATFELDSILSFVGSVALDCGVHGDALSAIRLVFAT